MESQFDSMRSQVTQLLACSQLIVSAATSIEGELQFVGDYLCEIKAAAGPLVEPSSGVDESSREGWDSSPYPSSSVKLKDEDLLLKVTTAIAASREAGKDVVPSSLCTEASDSMSSCGLLSPVIKQEGQGDAQSLDQRDDAFWAASYQRRQARQLQQRRQRSRGNFYRRTDYFGDWEEQEADDIPTAGPSRLPLADKDKSPDQAASPFNEKESSARPRRPEPSPQDRFQMAALQDSPEAHSPALLTLPRQEALATTMDGRESEEGEGIDEGRDQEQQDAEMMLAGRSLYDEVGRCPAWHPPRPWSS